MRHALKLSLPAIAASLLVAACGSSSSGNTTSSAANSSSNAAIVKTASSSLGTILVDSQGMTLYHLGGEQNGKFICTGSCLGVWHPLIAPSSGAPTGEVGSLGTVKRPEGTTQVTYKGTPLYTFAQDKQAGETNGQGIKDVGTWSAVTTSANANSAPPSTGGSSEAEKSGGAGSSGGYGY